MNDELLQLVITMAWCMWFNRNVVRQCKTQQLVAEILQNAKYFLEEFQMANFMLACHETYDILQWIPLTQSWYKINTNGATFVNTQSVGDGVIIRDNKGQVEAALSKNLPILLGPTEIEAKSLEEGVLFVWDVSVQDMMVLESDSKIVVVLIGTSETLVAIDNNIGRLEKNCRLLDVWKFLMLSEMAIVQHIFWLNMSNIQKVIKLRQGKTLIQLSQLWLMMYYYVYLLLNKVMVFLSKKN